MQSSLRDQVDDLLTEYSKLTRQFFQSLNTIAENASVPDSPDLAPEQLVKSIINVDAKLQSALDEIDQHQTQQQRIIRVQDDIERHQVVLLTLVQRLNEVREGLDKELTQAKKERKKIRYAEQSNVDFTDILSYASKLSKYTSAPPGFDLLSAEVKVDFEKPYPDEERMRRGQIYRQYTSSQSLPGTQEEQFETLSSESSDEDERGNASEGASRAAAAADDAQDNFWILDLNPDLPS